MTRHRARVLSMCLAAGTALAATALAGPVTTVFTYQGELQVGGVDANGLTDFRFTLFDAAVGGSQIGATITHLNVNVVDGVFTVELDFGDAAFLGEERWLSIEVRKPAGGGGYTTLSPRQPVLATPYAMALRLPLSQNHDTADNVLEFSNGGTGRVLHAIKTGASGLAAIRADSAGDVAILGLGTTSSAEGVGAISTGGADALVAQALGTAGNAGVFLVIDPANPDPAIYAATSGTGPAAHIDGLLDLGTGGVTPGAFRLFDGTGTPAQIVGQGTDKGGYLDLFDEIGNLQSGFEADVAGAGGFAYVYRSTTSLGFAVDGNYAGTNDPRVSIAGSGTSAVFDMSASGDASVALPASSVSASEMLDEPGVANNHANSAAIPTSTGPLISRTITVPADGYVLVIASGDLSLPYTGSACSFAVGVSDSSTTIPIDQDMQVNLPAGLPSGTYDFCVGSHGLFSVSAGSHTFYFNGVRSSGFITGTVFDLQLTLVYFPTAYGTVVSNFRGGGGGEGDPKNQGKTPARLYSASDIAAERELSMLDNYLRMQKELKDMQAQTLLLQKELDEIMRAQQKARGTLDTAVRGLKPIVEGGDR